ncbi:PTB domain-containing engulfment adapter protein 1 [Chelonia mydas]|uniref:PTB domain-containing engulfment adapter protein 1 n=1 Tax=Chelonia mydas TaxID=8469 RepID=M7BDH1_CHEMY|nr:PTB domain-containing engulfment adapter protein 1 [Chelonia mydas]
MCPKQNIGTNGVPTVLQSGHRTNCSISGQSQFYRDFWSPYFKMTQVAYTPLPCRGEVAFQGGQAAAAAGKPPGGDREELQFARHIKKSEGQKTPKVELQISIYGVKILDPKTKEVQHNCQLHRISFCADDKTDKRIFTFICKDSESNKHLCYVFDSEKCAEEITLTIGQAFDLAYRKFLESGGKDVETRKQIAGLQKRIQELETENIELKNKVQDLENQLRINQIHTSPAGSVTPKSPSTDIFDMVPFSPISPQSSTPTRNGTQPPPVPSRSAEIKRDLFGAEPFDPFSCGAGDFPPDIQSKLDEMQKLKPYV